MSVEGWEELTLDEDISVHVGPEICSRFASNKNVADLDLEFLDLEITG